MSLAVALTAGTLGSLLYLADRVKHSGRARIPETDVTALPAQVPSESPDAAMTPAPLPSAPVTYLSLDELRAKCVEEVRQATPPPLGADSFCGLYARVTKRNNQDMAAAAPAPMPQLPEVQEVVEPQARERTYAVWVNDCRALGYGSIVYRKCRAAESKRLSRECNARRAHLNRVGYSASDDERGWMRAWCDEASRYQIVN